MKPPARSKYRAIRTEVDGITFASKREANRYAELKMLEKVGAISDLELQPRFPIVVRGEKVCTYVADFKYYDRGGVGDVGWAVEDVKGIKTPVYRLKAKLLKAITGITVREV